LSEELSWDKEKGELRILGSRQTAITAQKLCDYLDSLVGLQVAEVIMNNLEFRLGKEEAAAFRQRQTSLSDVIDLLTKYDSLTGVGVTKVSLPENEQEPITLEISNPSVKGTSGAARAFLFSWWCGALTTLLGRDLEARDVTYSEERDVMKCRIVPRSAK